MPPEDNHRVRLSHLIDLMQARGFTVAALAEAVGITQANLSVLKNDRARAIRFSTLTALCDVLDCQPGDLFTVDS
ncbi:MAG: helix-turn-helix transcriptional regulator [Marmoricola sp.]